MQQQQQQHQWQQRYGDWTAGSNDTRQTKMNSMPNYVHRLRHGSKQPNTNGKLHFRANRSWTERTKKKRKISHAPVILVAMPRNSDTRYDAHSVQSFYNFLWMICWLPAAANRISVAERTATSAVNITWTRRHVAIFHPIFVLMNASACISGDARPS